MLTPLAGSVVTLGRRWLLAHLAARRTRAGDADGRARHRRRHARPPRVRVEPVQDRRDGRDPGWCRKRAVSIMTAPRVAPADTDHGQLTMPNATTPGVTHRCPGLVPRAVTARASTSPLRQVPPRGTRCGAQRAAVAAPRRARPSSAASGTFRHVADVPVAVLLRGPAARSARLLLWRRSRLEVVEKLLTCAAGHVGIAVDAYASSCSCLNGWYAAGVRRQNQSSQGRESGPGRWGIQRGESWPASSRLRRSCFEAEAISTQPPGLDSCPAWPARKSRSAAVGASEAALS